MIYFQANDKVKKVIKSALDSAKNKKNSDDPKVQPLVEALQGRIPTYVICNLPGEVMHLFELLEPYDKMKPVLIAGTETHLIAKELAKRKIPVIIPAQIDFERNTRNRINIPRVLAEAEVKIALKPESDSVRGHEDFLRQIGQLVKSGLDKEIAKKGKKPEVNYTIPVTFFGKGSAWLKVFFSPSGNICKKNHFFYRFFSA